MTVSQRAQYALKAVLELAGHDAASPLSSGEIAGAQEIPQRFLNNILLQLRSAGLIASVRGQHGGYVLNRPPSRISVGEVLRAVDGPAYSGARPEKGVSQPFEPTLRHLWEKAHGAMMDVYDSTSLQDLLDEAAVAAGAADYVI